MLFIFVYRQLISLGSLVDKRAHISISSVRYTNVNGIVDKTYEKVAELYASTKRTDGQIHFIYLLIYVHR